MGPGGHVETKNKPVSTYLFFSDDGFAGIQGIHTVKC